MKLRVCETDIEPCSVVSFFNLLSDLFSDDPYEATAGNAPFKGSRRTAVIADFVLSPIWVGALYSQPAKPAPIRDSIAAVV
jgi:hypothetical protein